MKLVLITGATKGLGIELANECLKNDYKIIGAARSKSKSFISLQDKFGADIAIFKKFDLSKGNHNNFIKEITKVHGNIYGVINNAAIGSDGVLATMHDSEIYNTININLISTILLTKYAMRSMLLEKSGRIINISSIIANTGFNGLSVYAASKSGLIGFTKSLAREVGRVGITCNTICPGYMKTDMTIQMNDNNLEKILRRSPLKRLISTREVAKQTVYLLSKDASGITGATFTLDAGSTC